MSSGLSLYKCDIFITGYQYGRGWEHDALQVALWSACPSAWSVPAESVELCMGLHEVKWLAYINQPSPVPRHLSVILRG